MAVWSVIPLSEVQQAERLDSEHFHPNVLEVEGHVRNGKYVLLGDIAGYIRRGIQPEYSEEGAIPALRTVNIREEGLSDTRQEFVSLEFYKANSRGQVFKGDILITSTGVGTLGRVTYNHKDSPYFADGHITLVREVQKLHPLYITTFLQTKTGLALIERRQRGSSGQIEIYPSDIARIPIPCVNDQIQGEIVMCSLKAQELRVKSHTLYAEAEALLLRELGLEAGAGAAALAPQTTYTATFGAARAAGRFDAEYFQPRYANLIRRVNATGQAVRLGDWVLHDIKRGVQPDYVEDGNVPVINSQHVGKTHIELEDNRATTWDFVKAKASHKRAQVKQYDILLNSTGYITIGRCQTMLEDTSAIVDGHVSIIRPKPGLDPVYLGLYLNALPGQLQTERGWTGSSGQIELRPDTVSDYVIWKAPVAIQQHIRQLVVDAHTARQEARHLLDEAKGRVKALVLGEQS